MYVKGRTGYDSWSDPFQGLGLAGFGALDARLAEELVLRLTPCVLATDPSWQCVFEALLQAAEQTEEAQIVLQTIADTASVEPVLTSLGFNPEAVSVLSLLLAASWPSFRSWAGSELNRIRSQSETIAVLPESQGGGFLVTGSSGRQWKQCVQPLLGPDGKVNAYSIQSGVPADQSCAQFVPASVKQPATTKQLMTWRRSREARLQSDLLLDAGRYKADSRVSWYKSKVVWIGAAVVVVGATVAVVLSRRRRSF